MTLLLLFAVLPLQPMQPPGGSEGYRERSVSLNGPWEFAIGEGDEGAGTPAGQASLAWSPVTLPGPFLEWSDQAVRDTAFAWARREFHVSAEDAEDLAILRWNAITFGATAYINGREVGHHDPIGPYQVMLPRGVLRPGANQIVLKVAGTRGAPKAKSGFLLVPAGFWNAGGLPAVTDDVWLEFADRAYLKWALAIPDLAGSAVRIRVTPAGSERLDGLTLQARVRALPDGVEVGVGQCSVRLTPDPSPLGGEHFTVDVPMTDVRPWTFENRNLYEADLALLQGDRLLDNRSFTFGMRDLRVEGGNYKLNGRNLWLRGSNLVFEWEWGDTITGHEVDYLVTEAREMSMNSFRTHTRPLPRHWADICDAHGTMILAEFPLLYNYQDYRFTPEELEVWHRNCLLDAAGWMTRLWNHPSVIMWVLSNESTRDDAWEEGPYQDFVNALDPTRPTLRTGASGTRDNYDVHTCGNVTATFEGNLFGDIPRWFATAGGRTTTNTEYMNYFDHPMTQWTGVDDSRANQIAVAQIGAEHTEAMRRARLDGIWPYMYAGWTRTRLAARVRETGQGSAVWKAGFAAPESAAWHSSLSPVLASLDLFDPSYATGEEVTTELALINDSWHDAQIHVDLLLTRENPEYIPEAECLEEPIARWAFDVGVPADSVQSTPVRWRLPEEEGSYWLTARTTGIEGRPVLSQRRVRAVAPAIPSDRARERTLVLLGVDHAVRDWLEGRGLRTSSSLEGLTPQGHMVIIGGGAELDRGTAATEGLLDFAARGGRVLALSRDRWDWKALCDVTVGEAGPYSRVFPHPGAIHPMLAGVPPEWLMRWNGLPGTVARGPLTGPGVEQGVPILWAVEPGTQVAVEALTASGDGRVLFCQLDLQGRALPGASKDPVAERVLLNLLGW